MNKLLISLSICLLILTSIVFLFKSNNQNNNKIIDYNGDYNVIDNMPLVENDPFETLASGGAPIEKRSDKYRDWLSASLKIRVNNTSGSGTIIYYDKMDKYAYVQSCGHLWNGNMTSIEGLERDTTCKVITWYHNDRKLNKPREYVAQVLYYSNSRGRDISLLRFKPDWAPNYFPIAPESFEFTKDMHLNSLGCDGGREVAHYDVRCIGFGSAVGDWKDLVTTENSPRPGRSGGGLMTNNYYVGTCWGTSEYSGSGNGFFTPLSTIRQYNKQNGYAWLNEVSLSWARMVPVKDHNNPQGEYPRNYIPVPN